MLRRILAGSRYLIIIAVVGALLASITVLINGVLTVLAVMIGVITHPMLTSDGAKRLSVESVEIIDMFLLGAILYIVALGFYTLFIDDQLPIPSSLVIHTIDDLKERLIGVVIVLLAVSFLGNIVLWNGNVSILALGIAVSLVLFSLGFVLSRAFKSSQTAPSNADKDPTKTV